MYKWVLAILLAVVSFSLYFVAKYGLNPKPLRKINPSVVVSMTHAGELIFRRMNLEIKNADVVVLGSLPIIKAYSEVWSGLLGSLESYGFNYDKLYEHDGLQKFSEQSESFKTLEQLKEHILKNKNKKIIVHTSFTYSSSLINEELHRFLYENNRKPIFFTQSQFVPSEDLIKPLLNNCNNTGNLKKFYCAAQNISERYFRKKYNPDQMRVALEGYGQDDFILFVYQPNQVK